MIEYYDLLKKMEAKPAMWTGELSLKSIRTFLSGYSYALEEYNLDEEQIVDQPNFHDWVAEKLGFFESTPGWANMILAVTIGLNPKKIDWTNYDLSVTKEQHKKSIQKFYLLLEEFVTTK